MRARSLVHGYEVFGEARKDLRAVLRDDDEVLDPDAAFVGEVDPRLDGDDVARAEGVRRLAAQPRLLVHLEAHAGAEPVAELVAEAGLVDHRAGRCVRVDPGGPGPGALEPGLLALEADRVGVLQPVGERAGREGARAVRAVAVDQRAR